MPRVVIGRVRQPGRPEEMLLAAADKARLRYVGRAFNAARGPERERLAASLDATERTTPPIAGLRVPGVTWKPGVTWNEPKQSVTVRHLATAGALRHATVEGLAD
jgi:hypothetical protein